MCGFVFSFATGALADPGSAERLARMSQAIAHRGPDQQGQLAMGPAGLAHRRLRIIDLDGGKQPMVSADGQVALVFNGEIYNFKELVPELRALGHTLSGKSDTETLLAAYLSWGEACVDRLNGMFAFVVYDARTGRVFAARDRFGEKPFYYTQTRDTIYLASELKALVAGGVVEPVLDRVALYSYFTLGYITGPRTVYAGVRRLQPGHALRIVGGKLETWRYWSAPTPTAEIDNERDAIARTLELLHDSVRLRLVSDVPLGFFLSGGIDSSAVVAVAHDLLGSNLDTFTIGFDVASHDERGHASFVAKRFGTRHRDFVLRPESTAILEDLAWHLDEPFADDSALATWYLSRMTREHVTVAMSGDGGDELFCGYDVYKAHALSERVRRLPAPMRRAAVAVLRGAPAPNAGVRTKMQKLARNIEDAGLDAGPRFVAKQQTIFRPAVLAGASPLLAPSCVDATDRLLFPELFDAGRHPLDAIAAWQRSNSLVDDMLVKVDRTSMAFALEVRTPFLDHRFAELSNRIALPVKLPGTRTKYVLKRALEGYFPREFLWRRKQGFSVPLNHWFKDDLDGFARKLLLTPGAAVNEVIAPSFIERVLGEHASLKRDWGRSIWALVMFELWAKRAGLKAGGFRLG